MTFIPSSSTCALHGKAGCYRQFARCRQPQYVMTKRKLRNEAGLSVTVNWCQGVHPKPQTVTDERCAHCPDWRDSAGRGKEEVERLMREGLYSE